MNREVAYLQIPEDYFKEMLDFRPRWSLAGDVIEWPDGSTFLFGSEIALFLEGYTLVGPLIHFAHIVQVLQLFDKRFDPEMAPGGQFRINPETARFKAGAEPLIKLFRDGRPHRNLGALCAWLCRGVPTVSTHPDPLELSIRLNNAPMLSALAVQRWATSNLALESEAPSLDAETFAETFLKALEALSPREISEWLKHGRGLIDDHGEQVARAIEAHKPRTLEGTIAALGARERLSGAVPMVAQLVSALTLPPRRLAHRALPTGGYADVGTRGRPEQILPSQFAIDDDEFIRRFAENELLYFHREEPHAPVTEEVVLLLDQGVRTWGKVRHALAAAALAFAKLAARRGVRLLVAGTSAEGRTFDPLKEDDETLGALWEASDLSPNPGKSLESILETSTSTSTSTPAYRDVVVLSHPRSLREAGFAAVAGQASPRTRVFSVGIDEPGHVQFREWRRGVAIKLVDFRVDFYPVSPSTPTRTESPRALDDRRWKGDVEPVGFPFKFGVVHRIDRPLFDLDHSSEWLLLSTYRGLLNAWRIDGSRAEIFPRAVVDGQVMEHVDVVLGVADGFVVGGRIGKSQVAMHYHFPTRSATARVLGPLFDADWQWFYSRELHTVVVRGKTYCRALDLSTGAAYLSRESKFRPSTRAIQAFEMANNHREPPPRLSVLSSEEDKVIGGHSVFLDRESGTVQLFGVVPRWEAFTPMSDGLPSLQGHQVHHAQLRGNVLALVVSVKSRSGVSLFLFHGPSGVPNREINPASTDPSRLILSPDGKYLARRISERQLEVRRTSDDGLPVLTTPKGKTHQDLKVTLGRYGMLIRVGKHSTLIRWDRGELVVSPDAGGWDFRSPPWPMDREANPDSPRPPLLAYDTHRFAACARAELTAVVDIYGQIILFDARDELIAMFMAFRSQVAAWLPNGTRFGSQAGASSLIDGPVTKDAARIIGQALKAASDAGARLE